MSEVIAAVDLGSNSFHLVVGELRHGQLTILDRQKETVRLSEGLEDHGELCAAAKKRALQCLSHFGERLRVARASRVRAAGTSTMRRASDNYEFRKAAEKALGYPIEVISGIEEARLIYGGVSRDLPPGDAPRLVLDIGGGSTELILGQGATPRSLESLELGCVSMTESCFPKGNISRGNFRRARAAARREISAVKSRFSGPPGIESIGTSGTILAAATVAGSLGIAGAGSLTPAAVEQLIERVMQFECTASLSLPGLPAQRAEVWAGGLAILAELLDVLGVDRLSTSDSGLREGLLYDQVGGLSGSAACRIQD